MKTLFFLLQSCVLSLWLLANAQAVTPAPDGGYPGGNTAEGQNALFSLITGGYNTAVGWLSLNSDVNGSFNTAIGAGTLLLNVGDPTTGAGTENTATGAGALLSNTTGYSNTANGAFALLSNTEGGENNAFGWNALANNTVGRRNVAVGAAALGDLTSGDSNIAVGGATLGFSETVNYNTALGRRALYRIRFQGDQNTGLGFFAGSNLTDGGANNIYIGNVGPDPIGTESNTIRLGTETATLATEPPGGHSYPMPAHTATYIAGINGQTASGGVPVYINPDGKLGTLTSSARFKTDITPMNRASEAILALKPVTFRYKKEIDPVGTSQFGLVAEDVEKVNPDLVVRDKEGQPYSVRYDQVNAMLLNEFLKEHRKVQEQETTIAQLKKDFRATVAQLTTRLDEQTAQIQKVSAQLATASPSRGGLEARKPAPQMVNNP